MRITLYHAGFEAIPSPDVRYGRKNADFGQGFYLSDNIEFSKRWARERKGMDTYLNIYSFETEGLLIKRLTRGFEWFDYISANRSGAPDKYAEYDVIIGAIANDTLYDTWGITTSGLLKPAQALELLLLGGEYIQTALKSDKAAAQLEFVSAPVLDSEEIQLYRQTVRAEEAEYQALFSDKMAEITGFTEDMS